MKFVYCVWQDADDPYGGGPYLIKIFFKEEDALKFVKDYNEECDKKYGDLAKYFYYWFEEFEIE